MSSLSTDLPTQNGSQVKTKITVIVPIRNEAAHIEATLRQLLEQDCGDLDVEILVADGRSTDATREIVTAISEAHRQIRLFDNPGRLSSAARNVGIDNSSGKYLVVIDGHCEIRSRTYFLDMVEAFERTQADCLGRPQPLDVSDATLFQQSVAIARNSRLGHHPDSFIYSNEEIQVPAISVAVAYRRTVFEEVGKFDPTFDACEDCELNHRIDEAGLTCYLVPKLAVHYKPRETLRGLFKQLMRYGRGRVRLARKHAESLKLSSVLPALFLLGILVGPIVSIMVPSLWFVYFGVLAFYALTILAFSVHASSASKQPESILWLPLIFPTVHLGAGWGVLREVLLPARNIFRNQQHTTNHKELTK